MDWYEMRVAFHRDPKVKSLRLKLREPLAEAYVARIYAYCYEHEQDSFPEDVAPGILEEEAGWKGKTGHLLAALIACGFVDHQDGELVVHGVGKRLGAAVKRRVDAARRKDEFDARKNAFRTSPERVPNACGTPYPTRPDQTRPDPMIDPDRQDHDRDLVQPTQRLAGALADFRRQLALRLGIPAVGIGRDPEPVVEFFSAQLAAVGQETVLTDCVEAAKCSRNGVPSSLSWFVGWLKRLPVPSQPDPGGVQ